MQLMLYSDFLFQKKKNWAMDYCIAIVMVICKMHSELIAGYIVIAHDHMLVKLFSSSV